MRKSFLSFLLTGALLLGVSSPLLDRVSAQVTQTPGSRAGGVVSTPLLLPTTANCSAPAYSYQGDTNTGTTSTAADTLVDCVGGVANLTLTANSLILRNATTAQQFEVGPAGDYLRFNKGTGQGEIVTIGGDALLLGTVGAASLSLKTADTNRWTISSAGHITADDAYNFTTTGNLVARSYSTIQGTLGASTLSLVSTATNDDPTENTEQNRVATTDATVTTLHTIAIPTSTTIALDCNVTARRTGGASGTAEDGAAYEARAVYKNVAGTATEIGENLVVVGESQAAWTADFAASAGNALLRVTGAAGNNITWHSTCRVAPTGS